MRKPLKLCQCKLRQVTFQTPFTSHFWINNMVPSNMIHVIIKILALKKKQSET